MEKFILGEFESQLISKIYSCALQVDLWRSVLEDIRNRMQAFEATLIFYDKSYRSRNFAKAAIASEEMNNRFVNEFIDIEINTFQSMIQPFNEGHVFDLQKVAQQQGETYENRLGDAAQFDTRPTWELRAAVPLLRGGSVVSCMGVYQPYQGAMLEQDSIDFLQRISHHIVHSIRIHNHISSLVNENSSLFNAIQQSTLGVFLLDKNLKVVISNNEAIRIIESRALCIGVNEKIHTPFFEDQILLDELLNQIIQDGFSAKNFITNGATIPIKRDKKIHPIKLTVLPIIESVGSTSKSDICLAVFANDPDRPWQIPCGYIQKVYGLTPVECLIAQALLDKMSIELVASARGTTLGTTRWQIKKIMEKTQTHSQAELCKLLMSLSNDFSINPLSLQK